MPQLTTAVTWSQCQLAAESVALAPYGREAIGIMRPRGPFGLVRRRGPVALQLYVAARDHLLVWRGSDSLAMLQPPTEKISPLAAPGVRLAVLRFTVRNWETVVFVGPSGLLLLGAGASALALTVGAGGATGVVSVLFATAALLYAAVMMTCLVAAALVGFVTGLLRRPRVDTIAAELMPGRQWSLVLCHHVERGRPEVLLGAAERQLGRVLVRDVRGHAAEQGVRVTAAQATETLTILRRAATTERLREAIANWGEQDPVVRDGAEITFRVSDFRPATVPSGIFDAGGFLLWYAGGSVAVLAALAPFVAQWERAACAAECAAHPATTAMAWRWLLQRLLLSDPYGLSPTTRSAWLVGWLVSLMSVTGLFVAVAALRQYTRARAAGRDTYERLSSGMQTHTLIMVATPDEHRALSSAVCAISKQQPEESFLPHQVVTRLGVISNTRISLVQVEPGTVGPGAAAIAAASLVTRLEPDFLILAGICYGLHPGPQDFGDVLVSTQLRAIDVRKVAEPTGYVSQPIASGQEAREQLDTTSAPDGDPTVIIRGDHVTPSPMLLGRMRAAARAVGDTITVHLGPMLTANTLVSSRKVRDDLHAAHPEAIGGEMEGAGVYAAAAHAKVDWIVVKGICDWGFRKSDEHHRLAASNAAALIVRAAELGGLDEAPARGTV